MPKKKEQQVDRVPYPYAIAWTLGKFFIQKLCKIHLVPNSSSKETCFLDLYYEKTFLGYKGLNPPKDFKYLRLVGDEQFSKFQKDFQALFNPIFLPYTDFAKNLGQKSVRETFVGIGLCDDNSDSFGEIVHVLTKCGWETLQEGLEQGMMLSEICFREINTITKGGFLGLGEFFLPLIEPKPGTTNLGNYIFQSLQMKGSKVAREGLDLTDSGICLYPNDLKEGQIPRSFVPDLDWFSENVKELGFRDYLGLFPEAEQNLFALTVGRILVGWNKSRTLDGHIIYHGWRKMAIVYGKEPRQGKSMLFSYIIEALQKCGYTAVNFRTLGERFGLGRVVESNLAYKDDFIASVLKDTLTAPETKSIISGGVIETEIKNTPSIETPCHTTIFGNTNKIDPRIRFDLDPGIVDRIILLTTLSNLELDELANVYEVESFKPFIYLNKILPEKLEVPRIVLMLYFLRLCLDKFFHHLQTESLEQEVDQNVIKLRTTIESEHQVSLSMLMTLSICLSTGKREMSRHLDGYVITEGLKKLSKLAYLPETQKIREFLENHWEKSNRPMAHPYKTITGLLKPSILRAIGSTLDINFDNPTDTTKYDLPTIVKNVYTHIHTQAGFAIGSGLPYILEAWEQVYESKAFIFQIYDDIINEVELQPGVANIRSPFNFQDYEL